MLPALEELDGFCSASLMVDRATGRGVVVGDVRQPRRDGPQPEHARELRSARSRDLGADVTDVGEFELAIARLRVPEMA